VRIAMIDSVHPLLAERLEAAGHRCVALHQLEEDRLPGALGEIEGIVVRSRRVGTELLDAAPSLRFVGRVGAGLENIDVARCQARGIAVLASPEGNRDGVGELCVAQLLVLMKHIARCNDQVHRGLWQREENRGTDLRGRTVGIIGFGNTGTAFAEKLQGFGVRVLAHDKYRTGFTAGHVEEASLEEVLAGSDAISLHLPLNAETRYYVDEAFFGRLGRPVWFLNTSRGAVVRTAALLDAIDQGRVLGAALDVLEFERPDLGGLDPALDPATQRRLLGHPGVLLTPHIAGVTHEGKRNMADVLASKLLNAFPHAQA